MAASTFLLVAFLALITSQAIASDPSPLQDFCVADKDSPVKVNGFVCKDPMAVNADDFFKAAKLDQPRDTTKSKVGSNVTLINVMQLPGLNTLGISLARIDYAPLGQNPPHTHPRATEILTVLEGTLYVRFVTSNQADRSNKLFAKRAQTQTRVQNQMAASTYFLLVAFLALVTSHAIASDPSPLQDFCVADKDSPVKVNGFVCKDPMAVNADDFFKAAKLDQPRDTTSKVGSNVTLINVLQLPGLNTLGISLARIDYAPLGQNPPHTHPRATEILTVLEGTLYVGFVTSNQADKSNKLFAKVLNKGDVFVFPQGLIHFQFNPVPDKPAVALAALSSQNPGAITIANAVFGSKPPISNDVLAKAFQVQKGTIDWLQAQFWENNHN
ncbi:putative germin-like protein 12-4 [Zea mays]|nr:putative germin-like protein 12-4 [Zea mays]